MSTSVLFDAPGSGHRGPAPDLHRDCLVGVLAVLAWAVWRLYDAEQFEGDKWEVFVTPEFVRALLVDGLLETLKMAFTAILAAVVFGFVFGVGKLSQHGWIRWPSWAVVEFFRAVPVLLLMVFIWYALGIAKAARPIGASSSRSRSTTARCSPRSCGPAQRRAARAGRGGVRHRDAQDPGHELRADAAGSEDHAPGHHQPMCRGVEGHRPRAVHRGAGPDEGREGDLPRSAVPQQPGADPYSSSPCCTSPSTCCSPGWPTWAQKKFVGEKKILEVSMVAEAPK